MFLIILNDGISNKQTGYKICTLHQCQNKFYSNLVFEVMDTPQPLHRILSESGRNALDYFVPQYCRLPFRDNRSYSPDSKVLRNIQLMMAKHSEMKRIS